LGEGDQVIVAQRRERANRTPRPDAANNPPLSSPAPSSRP
jgi:hypothetical protein